MRVNGEDVALEAGETVQSLLAQRGHETQRVAVERNGEIVPRAAFADTLLHAEDTIEIVAFVGGG